jgi:hypothetical protein
MDRGVEEETVLQEEKAGETGDMEATTGVPPLLGVRPFTPSLIDSEAPPEVHLEVLLQDLTQLRITFLTGLGGSRHKILTIHCNLVFELNFTWRTSPHGTVTPTQQSTTFPKFRSLQAWGARYLISSPLIFGLG